MVENRKKHGVMDVIIDGLGHISQRIADSIFPPMADGTERIMRKIEESIRRMERRILRKIFSLLIIGFGGILLIFALFSFLIEYLKWDNTSAFFVIGITIFVIGIMLILIDDR